MNARCLAPEPVLVFAKPPSGKGLNLFGNAQTMRSPPDSIS